MLHWWLQATILQQQMNAREHNGFYCVCGMDIKLAFFSLSPNLYFVSLKNFANILKSKIQCKDEHYEHDVSHKKLII